MLVRMVWLLLVGSFLGCSLGEDPQVQSIRDQFLLAEEPADAAGVLDIREAFDTPEKDVVVVGQIGGVDDPWNHGSASFVVADASHLAICDAAGACEVGCDCVFCRQKQEHDTAPLALVKFHDQSGSVLPIDARKLFDLSERQTIVVRGKAQIDKAGVMVIAADGMYIRR